MATELLYTAGDSNYLKVVLLGEVINVPVLSFSKIEGKLANSILKSRNIFFFKCRW